jgi:NADH-quinone oxidoreductase subunit N
VPFTTGFFAKFTVIEAAIDARSFWLALVAMLSAVIAAYLYLRIVVSMYILEPLGDGPMRVKVAPTAAVALLVTVVVTIVFGILPDAALNLAKDAVPVLVASS